MRKAALPLLTLLLLALTPAATAAATKSVGMNDGYSFINGTVSIARGDSVKWTNNANGQSHDVHALGPYGFFKSGGQGSIHPHGDSYKRTFNQAGKFEYVCLVHSAEGMKGTITVPITVTKVTGSSKFKITVAAAAFPSGSAYENRIEIQKPGQSWALLKVTRNASTTFKPGVHGTYSFRSSVQKANDAGDRSDPSPAKSISY